MNTNFLSTTTRAKKNNKGSGIEKLATLDFLSYLWTTGLYFIRLDLHNDHCLESNENDLHNLKLFV